MILQSVNPKKCEEHLGSRGEHQGPPHPGQLPPPTNFPKTHNIFYFFKNKTSNNNTKKKKERNKIQL